MKQLKYGNIVPLDSECFDRYITPFLKEHLLDVLSDKLYWGLVNLIDVDKSVYETDH